MEERLAREQGLRSALAGGGKTPRPERPREIARRLLDDEHLRPFLYKKFCYPTSLSS